MTVLVGVIIFTEPFTGEMVGNRCLYLVAIGFFSLLFLLNFYFRASENSNQVFFKEHDVQIELQQDEVEKIPESNIRFVVAIVVKDRVTSFSNTMRALANAT